MTKAEEFHDLIRSAIRAVTGSGEAAVRRAAAEIQHQARETAVEVYTKDASSFSDENAQLREGTFYLFGDGSILLVADGTNKRDRHETTFCLTGNSGLADPWGGPFSQKEG